MYKKERKKGRTESGKREITKHRADHFVLRIGRMRGLYTNKRTAQIEETRKEKNDL
jgi:hypothetical protein